MNTRNNQFLPRTQVGRRFLVSVAFGLSALGMAGWILAQGGGSSGLSVHEWGTFTAVAGEDGQAVEWQPLAPVPELPSFVEHFGYANFKNGLRGTIRMETPVMYFYSPQDVTISVKVAFARGMITEWYPHASRVEPRGEIRNTNLTHTQTNGTIAWKDITVSPHAAGVFPREGQENRYYAARETGSSPVRVMTSEGEQQEKFLFYRGVSAAPPPLSAKLNPDGRLLVTNLGKEGVPALFLFERRGENVGYRAEGALTGETVLDPPDLHLTVDSLCQELEGDLVAGGLYPDEARAMVTTWRDSWFEEGSRLIYLVPRGYIDSVLPLSVDPEPEQIVRVFVGRLEIVTPATARAVEAALASDNWPALNKYGRFLDPILQIVKERHAQLSQRVRSQP